MTGERFLKKISEGIVNFDAETVKEAILMALKQGVVPLDIFRGISSGLDVVGEKYVKGEYFLSELIMAGETAKAAAETLEPYLKAGKVRSLGKVVIGTVKGDLHDIGKNIVTMLLRFAGFDVYDLSADVSAEEFIEKTKEVNPDIVGMSALLSTTVTQMKIVLDRLSQAGLRDLVRVIIGGPPTSEKFAEEIKADAYAPDAVTGLRICKEFVRQGTT